MSPIVLSIFDRTGNAVRPWRDAGYECWCVDEQHDGDAVRDGIRFIEADLRDWIPTHRREYAMVLAWPPCTHLAVSGARWFVGKGLGALRDSVDLFSRASRICEAVGSPYLIENPVSTISTYWRKPDYTFNPCDYALFLDDPSSDAYTKQTCLWTGCGFVMPEYAGIEPFDGSKMHAIPPWSRPRQHPQRDADGICPRRVRGQPQAAGCRMKWPITDYWLTPRGIEIAEFAVQAVERGERVELVEWREEFEDDVEDEQ